MCQENGGDVAIATNLGENNFISFIYTDISIWLGGKRVGTTNTFEWTFRGQHVSDTTKFEPAAFLPWLPGQPDNTNGAQNCLVTNWNSNGEGKWNDLPCNFRFAEAVCERKYFNIATI